MVIAEMILDGSHSNKLAAAAIERDSQRAERARELERLWARDFLFLSWKIDKSYIFKSPL